MEEKKIKPEEYERIYLGVPINNKESDIRYFYKNYTHQSLSEMIVDFKQQLQLKDKMIELMANYNILNLYPNHSQEQRIFEFKQQALAELQGENV